ncbi:MAG: pyruvate kinase [Gammaproteobacteria bacterium]|jgi:pyruvate kinase|nr:pyruvate kinase [Gammaproteobacteria bacterium]MCH1550974.1 pyruvate kinase [Pseudomonadales bacterium]
MSIQRTKIICTIGPATASFEMLEELYHAGMNMVRLNMSHSDHASALKIINWIKTLNRKVDHPIPILLDTQGPEIRTGDLEQPMTLNAGEIVTLTVRDSALVETKSIKVNYDEIVDVVEVGRIVTVDNGLLNFEVLEKADNQLTCLVVDGGMLGSRKHVNLPGVRVNLPAITKKDREDITFGINNEVDFIALSFVRSPDDVTELREFLGAKRNTIKIIAKIEDQEGVTNIHDIARLSDGVMVARGDLGIETELADLPNVQRRIVHSAAQWGRRCIVATHLLESMIEHPIPTRAEVTDVANAIYEGVDAVMLSGETSVGNHPVRCVEQLRAIGERAERYPGLGYEKDLIVDNDKQHVAVHAVALAEALQADGIVVITRRGYVADFVTNARPMRVPIFAFTNHSQTRRRLSLNRAVFAFRTAFSSDPEKTLQRAFDVLRERQKMPENAKLVVISDVLADKASDAIQIRRLS